MDKIKISHGSDEQTELYFKILNLQPLLQATFFIQTEKSIWLQLPQHVVQLL